MADETLKYTIFRHKYMTQHNALLHITFDPPHCIYDLTQGRLSSVPFNQYNLTPIAQRELNQDEAENLLYFEQQVYKTQLEIVELEPFPRPIVDSSGSVAQTLRNRLMEEGMH